MLLEAGISDRMIWVEETIIIQVRIATIVGIETLVPEIKQEVIMVIKNHLGTEVRIMATSVEAKEAEVEVEVDLIRVPMLGDLE